jgi:type I restriction enzyme S subunit
LTLPYRGPLPVLLFGDHTRTLKYVDFAFALGADGVKVLQPSPWFEPKLLYYYLLAQEIPSRGYSRHFRFLKQISFPFMPRPEQRRIVEILDQADRLRRFCAEAAGKADRILPVLFADMFGDPATNSRGWSSGKLGDVLVETHYGTSARAHSEGAGVLVVRMNNISAAGRINLADTKYADLDARETQRLALRPGDMLFNRTNSVELVGKTGLWNHCKPPAVPASYLIRFRVDRSKVKPEYVWALMNTPFMKSVLAQKARRAVGMANINATELGRLPGLFPPLDLQEVFVSRHREIDVLIERYVRKGQSIERLFGLLLHRAFSGSLTIAWREAHLGELLQEMEHQAKALAAPAPKP